jgi:hypothetical protein
MESLPSGEISVLSQSSAPIGAIFRPMGLALVAAVTLMGTPVSGLSGAAFFAAPLRKVRTFGSPLLSKSVSSLSEIAPSYDGFVVDQWGVLFDANKPYDGALAALEELRRAKKKVVLISNSSKRRVDAVKNLVNKMKFGPPVKR